MNKQKSLVPNLRFKDNNGKDYPDWKEKKLGEVCIKISSNISKNKIENNHGNYVLYGANGILKKVDFYREKEAYISIVKDGAGVGRVLICKPYSSVLSTMDIIKPKIDRVIIYILFIILERINFKNYIVGSTIPHIYFKDYSLTKISLPCLAEQQKIADCLTSIDELIEAEQKQLETLQQHKKGLMQKLFSQEVRFKDNNGKDYPAWKEKKLGEVCEITTGKSNREDSSLDGEYTFFDRSEDIRRSNIYLFDCEAIIIAGEGSDFPPKYFVGKFDLHQRTYAIMKFKGLFGKYLFYYLHQFKNYLVSYAVGSTVKSLRLTIFQKMPISLPSLAEQEKIAGCLSSLDKLIELQTEKITTLKQHKKGLMQQFFPSDED